MPIIIKKRAHAPAVQSTAPEDAPAPRKIIIKTAPKAAAPAAQNLPPDSPAPRPAPKQEAPDLAAFGLGDAPQPSPAPGKAITLLPAASKIEYPPLQPGDRVRITNNMFPWVKHYAPGDIGTVRMVTDPMKLDDGGRYVLHVIDLDQPLEKTRLGQRCALFRWEIEKA